MTPSRRYPRASDGRSEPEALVSPWMFNPGKSGKPVRSFAAAVRAESAPTVSVRMNRGGGYRGNYGTAQDGFGAGRQGRGHGRTTGRNLTWERTNRAPPVQEEAIQEEE
ncbi:unnamed protein product [Miscanthus lutarioriparius]|uniref:Uncharacterized protein n=1 Tax=Miscanthus lutarioriparius TaxID=422564 RepID=A0A811MYX6_9POAL|nr:unnamed protein product [Miscanthus lutarioriparius]